MKALLEAIRPGEPDWELATAIDPDRLPAHIAIIMDGNGRWAGRRRLPRVAGHQAGIGPVRSTVENCARMGIKALTLYAFSVENWRRPKTEIDFLMQLLREYIRQEMPLIQRNNIRMRFLGRADDLPTAVQKDTREATQATAGNGGMVLSIALNYGGRAEIVDAVNALLAERRETGSPSRFTESDIDRHLYTADVPDPDLLIRTSGEMRVSNFLLWQIAYAEIFVTETLWPDFNRARLLESFVEFQKRDRRYGGLGDSDEAPPAASELAGK